jgi:Flp pilus assembly protein CpaB
VAVDAVDRAAVTGGGVEETAAGASRLAGGRHRVLGRPLVPNTRAIVGGLLLALSGVATFMAWEHAAHTPHQSFVVAARPIDPGQRLGPADLRVSALDLPRGVAAGAFGDPAALIGRVALGPIGEAELVQASQLSEGRSAAPGVELAFALPTDRAVDGQLRSGDRVDVYVTYPDQTLVVAAGVQVVRVAGAAGEGFSSAGQTVTVTLGIPVSDDTTRNLTELVHAVRAGEVTLVRSTDAVVAGVGEGGG